MEAEILQVSKRKLRTLVNDTIKTAEAANLIYVTDAQPGIIRTGKDTYKHNGKVVKDAETLARIKSLVLPPAWTNVWICAAPNGHLQATGFDVKHRKQYRYHPLWNQLRNHTKYYHLLEFGKVLPAIRKQLKKDLAQHELSLPKVLATVVSLMQCTCIRIGNNAYEKMNGSFGLTTLKDRHVQINGNKLSFSFKGKKGVYHDITLNSRKLARIVQACRDIPGKELFQYYDERGQHKSIDSGMVNNYIKEISGGSFTAKDFRTWAGTLLALETFKEFGAADTEAEAKRRVVETLDVVAKQLGNTRTVCKKYYVHPAIIDHYTNNNLEKYFSKITHADCDPDTTGLTASEQVLMHILEQ